MVVKPPEQIYLQCYESNGSLLDLVRDDVTWCIDQINKRDAVYILATSELAELLERLAQYANLYDAPESAYNARKLATRIREALALEATNES